MPPFLPPAAASSEVLRTLKEKNEAERAFEAKVADVEIAAEEIKSVQGTVDVQESTIQYAEGYRTDLEIRLITAQHMAAYFAESAKATQSAILDHKLQIQLLEDGLKLRQKELRKAEQNKLNAIEDKERAEGKLASAKADYEKAFQAAKARGLLPDIPDSATEKRKSKSPERQGSKDQGSRRRSRSRSLIRRQSDRRRSRSRDRPLASRDRRRPSPVERRRDGRRAPSPRRRSSPRARSPVRRRDSPPRRRTPPRTRPRSRSRERRKSTSPDRKRRREPSPKKRDREKSSSPGRDRGKARAKLDKPSEKSSKDSALKDKQDLPSKESLEAKDSKERRRSSPGDPKTPKEPRKDSKLDKPLVETEQNHKEEVLPGPPPIVSKAEKPLLDKDDRPADKDTRVREGLEQRDGAGLEAPSNGKAENGNEIDGKPKKDHHSKKEKKEKKHKKEKKDKREHKKEKADDEKN